MLMDKKSLSAPRTFRRLILGKTAQAQPVNLPTFELLRPHRRLKYLQQWVVAHGVRHLTLRDAAAIAGLELHHFSATFHRCVGVTFGHWMREYRVTIAVRALKCGLYSIEQVGGLVGYQDRRSLERAVKRATGTTPAELQRRNWK